MSRRNEENMNRLLDYLAVLIGAGIGFLYGEINGMFYALLSLCVLDYVTGLMSAIKEHNLSSKIGYIGIMRKVGIFTLVSVGHLVDNYIIKGGNVFMSMVILYYAANEGISICENAQRLGLPLPKKLVNILKQVREENDDDDSEKDNPEKK